MTICRHGLYYGVCERCTPLDLTNSRIDAQGPHIDEERIQNEADWALRELERYQMDAYKPFDGFTEYDRGMLRRMKFGL